MNLKLFFKVITKCDVKEFIKHPEEKKTLYLLGNYNSLFSSFLGPSCHRLNNEGPHSWNEFVYYYIIIYSQLNLNISKVK